MSGEEGVCVSVSGEEGVCVSGEVVKDEEKSYITRFHHPPKTIMKNVIEVSEPSVLWSHDSHMISLSLLMISI